MLCHHRLLFVDADVRQSAVSVDPSFLAGGLLGRLIAIGVAFFMVDMMFLSLALPEWVGMACEEESISATLGFVAMRFTLPLPTSSGFLE